MHVNKALYISSQNACALRMVFTETVTFKFNLLSLGNEDLCLLHQPVSCYHWRLLHDTKGTGTDPHIIWPYTKQDVCDVVNVSAERY